MANNEFNMAKNVNSIYDGVDTLTGVDVGAASGTLSDEFNMAKILNAVIQNGQLRIVS